jgi:hypothetical protein
MVDVQIHIIGKGTLDLLNGSNFPLVLNKSISDINDISRRDSFFSYDFEIPNNTTNNKILFGAEFVNAMDKAILGKQEAVILRNGTEYERGFVEVRTSRYLDKYTCNFFGGNADWVELGADVYLRDLDFRDKIHIFNSQTLMAINNGNVATRDFIYPFVDRNSPNDDQYKRPVFYVKRLFELFFEGIGYKVESTFLDSLYLKGDGSFNKGVAIDLGSNFEFDDDVVIGTVARYTSVLNTAFGRLGRLIQSGGSVVSSEITNFNLNSRYETLVEDDFNLFNPAIGYTAPRDGFYNFTFDFRNSFCDFIEGVINFRYRPGTSANIPLIILRIKVNGIVRATTPINSANMVNGMLVDLGVFLLDGQIATFELEKDFVRLDNGGFTDTTMFRFVPIANTFNIQFKSSIQLGDTYDVTRTIPKELKALDLISDLKLLFNLYFETNTRRKIVKIEPRNSWVDADGDDVNGYYKSVGLATNWTNLIDYSTPPEITTALPYKRRLKFRYKEDADDKWLKQWEKNNNRVYGEYSQDLSNRFENGETILETSTLAPTIQGRSSNFVTSVMRAEFSDLGSLDAEQKIPNNKYAPRIGWVVNGVFLMEQFADAKIFNTVGSNEKLTFNGVNGLIDKFWSKTLRNLINALTVKVMVRLDYLQLRTFDFSRPVYIDAPQQLKGYYVVQNIEANLVEEMPCVVELLYYKDYSPLQIDTSQRTNINENQQNQQNQRPRFVLFEDETTGALTNVLYQQDNGNLTTLIYE